MSARKNPLRERRNYMGVDVRYVRALMLAYGNANCFNNSASLTPWRTMAAS